MMTSSVNAETEVANWVNDSLTTSSNQTTTEFIDTTNPTKTEAYPQYTDHVSFLGRHDVESYSHYIIFCLHDIFAMTCLVLFTIQYLTGNNADINHVILGRITAIMFIGATITGFLLIHMRNVEDPSKRMAKDFNGITIITQGYSVIGSFLNAFIFNRWITNKTWFPILLLMIHLYSQYMGFLSLKFLLKVILNTNNEFTKSNFDTAIELSVMVTIPQIIFDFIFLLIHISQYERQYKNFSWRLHHKMSSIFLIYMAVPGVFYSFVHDSYWVFTSHIESLAIRLIPVTLLFVLFLYWNFNTIYQNVRINCKDNQLLTNIVQVGGAVNAATAATLDGAKKEN